jgi:hypothetical protein
MEKEALMVMNGNNELFVELHRAKDAGRAIYTRVAFNMAATQRGSKLEMKFQTGVHFQGETPKFAGAQARCSSGP